MTLEQQKHIERVAIDKKLKTAANMRDENIKKMLERLKEHVCSALKIHFIYKYYNFMNENIFHFLLLNFFYTYAFDTNITNWITKSGIQR